MTDECLYSVLDDPLFQVTTSDRAQAEHTLPEILAGLASGSVVSFDGLQFHQRQAWHAFLVQLATMALARCGEVNLKSVASDWRELLLSLTGGEIAPWCMVVDDVSKPAFLQSPIPEGSLTGGRYKDDVVTPDDIDILGTAKNHDVKRHRISAPRVEHWVYALVTLQTLEGFLGQGNYGISRMNGGFGNRPMIGLSPSLVAASRFSRDVDVLIRARRRLAEFFSYDLDGHALLWLLPWDGAKSSGLPREQCDPLFIEICRRLRFTQEGEQLRCFRANTKGSRISMTNAEKGAIGDPWTPIDSADLKALTVSDRGFTYRMLHRVLFTGDYTRPPSLEVTHLEASGAWVTATTLVRGQGKTGGWHHRDVPFPAQAIRLFGSPTERDVLGIRAQNQVEWAAHVRKRALFRALQSLLNGGTDEKVDAARTEKWLQGYEAAVNDAFFPMLWTGLPQPLEEASRTWKHTLLGLARTQLNNAIRGTPIASIQRYRAVSAAESRFNYAAQIIEDTSLSTEA